MRSRMFFRPSCIFLPIARVGISFLFNFPIMRHFILAAALLPLALAAPAEPAEDTAEVEARYKPKFNQYRTGDDW